MIFSKVADMQHEQVVFCHDKASGLKAIIAIHNTVLGPALGGCRLWHYESEEEALVDVLRLSRGMTYKAAAAGLNLGGGKSVIIADPKQKSEALFRTFGKFVHTLGGRYITAEDVNISVSDMECAALETPYVTGIGSRPGGSGDPSPVTALGVFSGLRAAVKHRLKRDDLKGLKVGVQGCGNVGANLCGLLAEQGVELYVTDINEGRVRSLTERYGAKAVDGQQMYDLELDVFAPCALGAILDDQTLGSIKAKVIAGGANNQLKDEDRHGRLAKEKGILYAPDYVINAGGLINVAHELKGYNQKAALEEARGIYDTLLRIFAEADRANIPTHEASDLLAEQRLEAAKAIPNLGNTAKNQNWIHI